MIGKLTGQIDEVGEGHVILDVNGVGYLVFASARTLARLGGKGSGAGLLIETHVREDHIHLYGFADAAERDWFRLLGTVQGVGARLALAILSTLEPQALADAISAADRASLTRAPGVGPKLAARVIAELKDKVGAAPVARPAFAAAGRGAGEDAISALVNLGYRRGEAFGAVNHALQRLGPEAPVEALITAGLKELSA
jgi:Holliday junction DNA helicase RuvA